MKGSSRWLRYNESYSVAAANEKMPILTLTNEQVVELVKQLPVEQQVEPFRFLLLQQWSSWESLSQYGADRVRLAARERGYDWDAMTEDEREALIDQVVHED